MTETSSLWITNHEWKSQVPHRSLGRIHNHLHLSKISGVFTVTSQVTLSGRFLGRFTGLFSLSKGWLKTYARAGSGLPFIYPDQATKISSLVITNQEKILFFPPSFWKQQSTAWFLSFWYFGKWQKNFGEGWFEDFLSKLSFWRQQIEKLSTRAYIPNSDQGKHIFNLWGLIFADGSKLTVDNFLFLLKIMISIIIFWTRV